MTKKLMITITALILLSTNLFMLSGCQKPVEGLEIGFTYRDDRVSENGIFLAVKSEKTTFDIDDVTIDLYYGTQASTLPFETNERYDPVCVAVYYLLRAGGQETLFDDYKNSGKYQLIKEIAIEDFYCLDYAVTSEHIKSFGEFSRRRYTYTYSEKFTLPNEYFIQSQSLFYIYTSIIFFDNEESKYCFSVSYNYTSRNETFISLDIGYKLLENNKVKLYPM